MPPLFFLSLSLSSPSFMLYLSKNLVSVKTVEKKNKNRPCVKLILPILEENICLKFVGGLSDTEAEEFRLL